MIRGFTGIFEQAGLGVGDLGSNRAIEFGSVASKRHAEHGLSAG